MTDIDIEIMNKIELSKLLEETCKFNNRSKSQRKLIYGVGINDANYVIKKKFNNKVVQCPCYISWCSMLARVYNPNYHDKYPTYKDVTVCKEWLSFSNFRNWWINNYIDGYQLDKDILSTENKIYSPDTCIYIPSWLNCFITDNNNRAGTYKLGCSKRGDNIKFKVHCNHPFLGDNKNYVGSYLTEQEAHEAYIKKKIDIAIELKTEMDKIDTRIFTSVISKICDNWTI